MHRLLGKEQYNLPRFVLYFLFLCKDILVYPELLKFIRVLTVSYNRILKSLVLYENICKHILTSICVYIVFNYCLTWGTPSICYISNLIDEQHFRSTNSNIWRYSKNQCFVSDPDPLYKSLQYMYSSLAGLEPPLRITNLMTFAMPIFFILILKICIQLETYIWVAEAAKKIWYFLVHIHYTLFIFILKMSIQLKLYKWVAGAAF